MSLFCAQFLKLTFIKRKGRICNYSAPPLKNKFSKSAI